MMGMFGNEFVIPMRIGELVIGVTALVSSLPSI
jgi:hypothetical protein